MEDEWLFYYKNSWHVNSKSKRCLRWRANWQGQEADNAYTLISKFFYDVCYTPHLSAWDAGASPDAFPRRSVGTIYDSTAQRLNDSTTQRLNGSTAQRLNDSTTQRLNDSTTQRLNDSTTQRLNASTPLITWGTSRGWRDRAGPESRQTCGRCFPGQSFLRSCPGWKPW